MEGPYEQAAGEAMEDQKIAAAAKDIDSLLAHFDDG